MPAADPESRTERHTRCRNLVWEASPDGSPAPGRYCANRLGVVHVTDCPVAQGRDCCLFDPRPDGVEAEPAAEDEIERLRERLARDYLRWPYWRRVQVLQGPEAPTTEVEDLPDVIEAGEAEEEFEAAEPVARPKPKPAAADESPKERYPGERRSEEAHRTPESAAPVDLDDVFAKGIFPEEPPPSSEPASPGEKDTGPGKPAETTEQKPAERRGKGRRRRRPRRRRGRGRGRGKGKKKPPS
jgi:hypothetical protein